MPGAADAEQRKRGGGTGEWFLGVGCWHHTSHQGARWRLACRNRRLPRVRARLGSKAARQRTERPSAGLAGCRTRVARWRRPRQPWASCRIGASPPLGAARLARSVVGAVGEGEPDGLPARPVRGRAGPASRCRGRPRTRVQPTASMGSSRSMVWQNRRPSPPHDPLRNRGGLRPAGCGTGRRRGCFGGWLGPRRPAGRAAPPACRRDPARRRPAHAGSPVGHQEDHAVAVGDPLVRVPGQHALADDQAAHWSRPLWSSMRPGRRSTQPWRRAG